MPMRRIFNIILLMAFGVSLAHAELSASQVLANTIKQINSAPSIQAQFAAATGDGAQSSGILKMRQDRFSMTTPEFAVWYNGRDMWSYYKNAKETSLSSPTDEELMEANPFFIINRYNTLYTAEMKNHAGGIYTLVLKPTSKQAAIRQADIKINDKTWLPSYVKATFANGSSITINISNMQLLKSPLPTADFEYPADKYPGIEIVDLR